METILGLDLGVNSVGWAVVQREGPDDTPTVEAGSYVYPEPGELEQGTGLFRSNRQKRGQKRRMRIQVRRKRQRMAALLKLLVAHGLLPAEKEERDRLLSRDRPAGGEPGKRPFHPFMLRQRGLDEELTLHELGRCLHHICRRRGYISTRDLMHLHLEKQLPTLQRAAADLEAEEPGEEGKAADKETSALLGRLKEVREQIEAGAARTIGEFCALRLADPGAFPGGVRASGKRSEPRQQKQDLLGWRADRFLVEEEFEKLWAAQARFHPAALTDGLREEVRTAIFFQRPLASKRGLVGGCEFLPARKRLARAELLAQRTSVLQTLVNLTVVDQKGAGPRRLTGDEVTALADALEHRDSLTWEEARQVAFMPLGARFSDEPERRKAGKRTRGDILGNRTASALRASLGDGWSDLEPEGKEEMVALLLHAHSLADVARGLRRRFGFTPDQVRAAASAPLSEGYTNHCRRVWADLEPHLRQGLVYSEACEAAGYREANTSTVAVVDKPLDRLGAAPDLRNPVVQRSVKMAFRVINAVIDRYGKPTTIRIELPRDVSRTNKQREQMWRDQDKRARDRKQAEKKVLENKPDIAQGEATPRGASIVLSRAVEKVLLWEEAGMRCPYEPDRMVGIQELLNDYDVEHIVPRSRCWDDSWVNKTICPRGLNLQKGNSTPFEWIGRGERWDHMCRYVRSLRGMSPGKRSRLLAEAYDAEGFTNRALSDTRYLSSAIKKEVAKLGVPVEVSRGQITAQLRSLWELGHCVPIDDEEKEKLVRWREAPVKKNEKPRHDHRHHALDAILAALTDIRTLQRMTAWLKAREEGIPRDRLEPPLLWPTLMGDLERAIERAPVVHATNRSVQGALHKETAYPPPAPEKVAAALAAAGASPGKLPATVVVEGRMVVLGPDGRGLKAYDLASNHHACIWQRTRPDGKVERDMTVTSMMEAARRAAHGEPVVQPAREGWDFVLSLCKSDIVEWTGDKPGLYRVATFSVSTCGAIELVLRHPIRAVASRPQDLRIQGRPKLPSIRRRVCLGPLGDEIASEPLDA